MDVGVFLPPRRDMDTVYDNVEDSAIYTPRESAKNTLPLRACAKIYSQKGLRAPFEDKNRHLQDGSLEIRGGQIWTEESPEDL